MTENEIRTFSIGLLKFALLSFVFELFTDVTFFPGFIVAIQLNCARLFLFTQCHFYQILLQVEKTSSDSKDGKKKPHLLGLPWQSSG